MSNGERTFSLFSQLVAMLTTSAFQQMGKIANPVTGRAEVDLEGAQASIDMLDMLAQKTKGNLDPDEERGLAEALTALRLNFVQASQEGRRDPEPRAESEPARPEAERPAPAPARDVEKPGDADESQAESGDDASKTRFHKTYG
jgi:hypothetical protein